MKFQGSIVIQMMPIRETEKKKETTKERGVWLKENPANCGQSK